MQSFKTILTNGQSIKWENTVKRKQKEDKQNQRKTVPIIVKPSSYIPFKSSKPTNQLNQGKQAKHQPILKNYPKPSAKSNTLVRRPRPSRVQKSEGKDIHKSFGKINQTKSTKTLQSHIYSKKIIGNVNHSYTMADKKTLPGKPSYAQLVRKFQHIAEKKKSSPTKSLQIQADNRPQHQPQQHKKIKQQQQQQKKLQEQKQQQQQKKMQEQKQQQHQKKLQEQKQQQQKKIQKQKEKQKIPEQRKQQQQNQKQKQE